MRQANEEFVIISVSRMAIADMCNDRITAKGLSIPPFEAGDDRLTGPLCEALAEAFSQLYDDLDEEDRGAEERVTIDVFLQNFV